MNVDQLIDGYSRYNTDKDIRQQSLVEPPGHTQQYVEILRLEINSRFASPNKTSYLNTTKTQKTQLDPWSF